MSDVEIQELKKHYVYELLNSHDNKVFYVGKGQGDRAHDHVKQALKTEVDSGIKIETIRMIEYSGGNVLVRVVGRYRTNDQALAVEATLINFVYGLKNLTNEVRGHGAVSIREKGEFGELPHIDIPEKNYSYDGEYSKKFEEARDQNQIVPFMLCLKTYMEQETPYRFTAIDTSKSRFTSFDYSLGNVLLRFNTGNNSSKKQIQIYLMSRSGKKEHKEYVKEIAKHSDFEVRNGGEYGKLPDWNVFSNPEEAKDGFDHIRGVLYKAIANLND